MVHTRPTLPSGHGELTIRPAYDQWSDLVERNRLASAAWVFDVGGYSVGRLRALARSEVLAVAMMFSQRLNVGVRASSDGTAPLIVTGHQPLLYHPGVWVKDFLLDRLAVDMGADSLDLVVDTDGFDFVSVTAPCLDAGVTRCKQVLAVGQKDSCFALTPVPSKAHIDVFRSSTAAALSGLSAPAVSRHFGVFCDALESSLPDAHTMAELVTIARRRYEQSANSGYLEALLTDVVETESFRRFVVHLALDALAFATAYNQSLEDYRSLTKTRSVAQPFPNLALRDDAIELPFWVIDEGRRRTLWVTDDPQGGVGVRTEDKLICVLPTDPASAADVLADCGVVLAPKALTLTLFIRMFVSDFFIHGIGGGRYDRVTDDVIRSYFGVEPPSYVVASLTMYLPLGAQVVTEADVATLKEQLHRLEHNPDALLGEVEFDTPDEGAAAQRLAREKSDLVARIKDPDADKKAIGTRIRQVNLELSTLLGAVREQLHTELERLEMQLRASDVLTDRTYPFCFWDPAEVADKIR
jgi:hypothetical protein